jgi:hypothetical protein
VLSEKGADKRQHHLSRTSVNMHQDVDQQRRCSHRTQDHHTRPVIKLEVDDRDQQRRKVNPLSGNLTCVGDLR